MTYYADLSTETMIATGATVRAIGWLEPGHEFPVGDTVEPFRSRLFDMSQNWSQSSQACNWPVLAGPHRCGFCGRVVGVGEFAVPNDTVAYIAPSLISHYVAAHRYCPPPEFVEAVLNCAPFSSKEYRLRVRHLLHDVAT